MSALIDAAYIRRLRNSRGEETVEVIIETESSFGSAIAPSGASKGRHEAVAFPEGGVEEAVRRFRKEVAPELIGLDSLDQWSLDRLLMELDGTRNFSRIGGSVAIATSMANLWAASNALGLPLYRYLGGPSANRLPLPLGNVIGGGKHALWRSIPFQEILVVPLNPPSYAAALSLVVEVHREAGKLLAKLDESFAGGRNDEGAWVTRLSLTKAMDVVKEAVRVVEKRSPIDVKLGIGLDVAASSLWVDGRYRYEGRELSAEEHYRFISSLIENYGLIYLEDPFHEEDFDAFSDLVKEFRDVFIVGDDLFVTNIDRLREGVKRGAANSILVKPNQVGTISGMLETVRFARENGYRIVVSHRSGETCDVTIAHLSVALDAPMIKTGIMGGERMAKHNELLRIEDGLPSSRIWNLSFK